MMTLSANLTHTYLGRKPQWLILALAVAAAAAIPTTKSARLPVRQPLRAPSRALGGPILVGQVRRREF
jgi:hypothetical protein